MHRSLAFFATLALAQAASAATLTLDTDKEVYEVGETVEVTLSLDTPGSEGGDAACCIFVTMVWNGSVGRGAHSSRQELTTVFSGTLTRFGPLEITCSSRSECVMFDQVGTSIDTFFTDAQVVRSTLAIEAAALGTLDFAINPILAFGLVAEDVLFTDNARNVRVVPEPSTAWLTTLGIAWLALRRRRV